MKTIINICIIVLGILSLSADTTNVIDIAALSACGTGTVEEWTVSGIDSYADKVSIRLNNKGEYLISPDFGATVKTIILKVKSSSKSGRRLAFIPYVNGDYASKLAVVCEYSPSKDSYAAQTLDFTGVQATSRFKISFDDPDNGSTGWGISYLAVVTSNPLKFSSPSSVTIDRIHPTSARICWPENEFVASNLVTISKVSESDATFSIRDNYDFELCENSGTGDSQDKSAELSEKYPAFSGEKIYYPGQSSGILRISTGSANGRLTHVGYQDYTGMAVEIVAKHHQTDINCSKIYAYYLDDEQQIHEIGSMDIESDFTTGLIRLDGVPGGAAINIGNLDGFKTNRRFVIDQIRFLADYTPGVTTTNIVQTAIAIGNSSCRIHGLSRQTEYLATVTAIDARGTVAKASKPTSFTTTEKDPGMLFRSR